NYGHEVFIIDNFLTGKPENIPVQAQFYEFDLNSPQTAQLIAQERFEIIFHQAAQLDVRKSVSDPAFDAEVNILGSIRILEAGIKNGLQKFIFASSGGTVYGEQMLFPAPETHPIQPLSPYGITKATVEKYLYYYEQVYQLPWVALRYANVYGPRQSPHGEAGVVAIFTDKMIRNQQPIINGDGLQTRDYVFVEDVITANLLAISDLPSGAYNVGTGIETNVIQIFDAINESFQNRFERKFGPAKAGEQRRSVLDTTKLQQFGWTAKTDLATGMKQTVEWFLNQHQLA
ncbi:MAG: NAD-dependent epimerase/dehydratase family protein, partial [Bacteroidia bacterium]|nr:NAD-dependent epimerase/dehydratase family protein [Bacteroidia bacterium]